MIKSITVENFRCFKRVELSNLRRINVVVGKNAAGKTALLEAIKIGLEAVPGVLPWINQYRMLPTFVLPNPGNDQFQSAFLPFFHDFNPEAAISTIIKNSLGQTASLRIYFDTESAITSQPSIGFQPGGTPISAPPTTIIPLGFERNDFQNKYSKLFITIDAATGQLQIQTGKTMGLVSGFFSNSYFGVPQENATWLSTLSVEKRSGEVIEAIRRHFPFIHDVTTESLTGGAIVYVDIPTIPRKLPISLVSGGISRLFTLFLAMVTFKGGVVLIDEVENGIFHDQYGLIWKTLADLANEYKTQLFISTHSSECMQALVPTLKNNEEDFTFLRAEKLNGSSTLSQFSGHEFEAALAKGGEVRGR